VLGLGIVAVGDSELQLCASMSFSGAITATHRRWIVSVLGTLGVVRCLFSSRHNASAAVGYFVSGVPVACVVCIL